MGVQVPPFALIIHRPHQTKVCYAVSYTHLDVYKRQGEKKLFDIGSASNKAMKALLTEMKKCDVVCANCHCDRTHQRKFRSVA